LVHVIIIIEVEVVFEHTSEKVEFACVDWEKVPSFAT
jgi:hypothetical protein